MGEIQAVIYLGYFWLGVLGGYGLAAFMIAGNDA